MAELPQGTVTFFFTDVEGSTRMVRELGDESWAGLLQTHRELVRSAVLKHNGHEFGTQGDAIFAAFAKATDATAAAIAAQQALQAHDWPDDMQVRIRLGLHSGEAIAHGDNYVGKEVHRAARICDVGHGGQILLSARTAGLVRDDLAADISLIDMGEHRLKDMGNPERLFQIEAPGLLTEFAQLRSLQSPSNLSAARSSFVGRDKELGTVSGLLEDERLVSLTGIGGSGKTRLAIEIGSRELTRFVDGVFFIDLAPLTDPELIAQAMAAACSEALGDILSGDVGGTAEDRLVNALAARSCLLIVDNCEHLIDGAADLLDRILADCPTITLLVTSREALGIEGEQIVPIPSLLVPDDSSDARAADNSDAVRLFAERAKSVKRSFAVGPDNRDAVVEICRRLDGIPLAIELAATRVAHLSVQQIAERLEDRFRLLTGGRRRIQRQQTLGAALDWSHDLLSEDERAMLRRISVFAGGFTLAAAEAVAAGDDLPAMSTLEIVGSLVAKSLVITSEEVGGETRYQLLETVRLYALDKLADAGEAEDTRTRHRDWYLNRLEALPLEQLSASPAAISASAKEIDNYRAAADWSISLDQPSALASLGTQLSDFWNMGAHQEGRRWLLEALKAGDRLSVNQRILCLAVLTRVCGTNLAREEGYEYATRAIELANGLPSYGLVLALGLRGFFVSMPASAPGAPEGLAGEARRDCSASIDVAAAAGNREWLVQAKALCAMAELCLGDLDATSNQYGEITSIVADDASPHALLPQALAGLAVAHHVLGDNDSASDAAVRGLACTTPSNLGRSFLRMFRAELTPALVIGGHEDVGCEVLRDEIEHARVPGVPLSENHVLGIAAAVEYLRGHPDRAGRLLGASRSLGGAAGTQIPFRTPASVAIYRHYRPLVRDALGPDEARRARDEGQAMTRDDAFAYMLETLS
jgi:predicted ATPase/class 3 adenylate cyclase